MNVFGDDLGSDHYFQTDHNVFVSRDLTKPHKLDKHMNHSERQNLFGYVVLTLLINPQEMIMKPRLLKIQNLFGSPH